MIDKGNFGYEILTQTKLALQTCSYLDPICPFIAYENIYSKDESKDFITFLKDKGDIYVQTLLNSFIDNLNTNNIDGIGLIAMELAEGFAPLYSFQDDPNFELYKNMARFQLLQLAEIAGYTQGDFHMENLLVNPDYSQSTIPSYFEGTNAYVMLIDFGLANKIPPKDVLSIKQYVNSKNYIGALNVLLNVPRFDNSPPRSQGDSYKWIVPDNDAASVNTSLSELYEGRQRQIQNIITYSKSIQQTPDNVFPILPVNCKKYIDYLPKKYYFSKDI